jgi:hypothetical protein
MNAVTKHAGWAEQSEAQHVSFDKGSARWVSQAQHNLRVYFGSRDAVSCTIPGMYTILVIGGSGYPFVYCTPRRFAIASPM